MRWGVVYLILKQAMKVTNVEAKSHLPMVKIEKPHELFANAMSTA